MRRNGRDLQAYEHACDDCRTLRRTREVFRTMIRRVQRDGRHALLAIVALEGFPSRACPSSIGNAFASARRLLTRGHEISLVRAFAPGAVLG